MPLTTSVDIAILKSWNLHRDYLNNKQTFIDVGRIVYQTLTKHSVAAPHGPHEMEDPLLYALIAYSPFKILCHSKRHASPTFHIAFARALARYMLDNEWSNIIAP